MPMQMTAFSAHAMPATGGVLPYASTACLQPRLSLAALRRLLLGHATLSPSEG